MPAHLTSEELEANGFPGHFHTGNQAADEAAKAGARLHVLSPAQAAGRAQQADWLHAWCWHGAEAVVDFLARAPRQRDCHARRPLPLCQLGRRRHECTAQGGRPYVLQVPAVSKDAGWEAGPGKGDLQGPGWPSGGAAASR